MAKAGKVEIFIYLSVYNSVLSDVFAQRVAAGVTIEAKKLVAHPSPQHPYSVGNLRNQIRTVPVGFGSYVSEVEETYALAQEYGLTEEQKRKIGIKNYSFKPYMRPGADEATTQKNLDKYLKEAQEGALNRSKI